MQNSLRSLIREALETAHKQGLIINEDTAAELAAKVLRGKMNPAMEKKYNDPNTPESEKQKLVAQLPVMGAARKEKADKVIDIIKNQKPGWENYTWDPSGFNYYDNLNEDQFNYIIESLIEDAKATNDPKYSKIFSNIYNVGTKRTATGRQAKSGLLNRLEQMSQYFRDLQTKDPILADEIITNAWSTFFYTQNWQDFLNSYISKPGANVGSAITTRVYNLLRTLLKDRKVVHKNDKKSLDAKNASTGKSLADKVPLAKDVDVDKELGLDFGDNADDDSIIGNDANYDEEDHTDPESPEQKSFSFGDETSSDFLKNKEKSHLILTKFQKAISQIINSAKTLDKGDITGLKKANDLTTEQKKGLFALEQVALNLKNYSEIISEFPEVFAAEDEAGNKINADVKLINSRLKSKVLTKAANEVLAPYNLTYDIFQNPDWQTKYNLGPEVVDQIADNFSNTSKASTTEKRSYIHPFKLMALQHKTPEEIAKIPASGIYKKDAEKAKTVGWEEVKKLVDNLTKSQRFKELSWHILHTNGFDISFGDINWLKFLDAAKKMSSGTQNTPAMASAPKNGPDQSKWFLQREEIDNEFIRENLDQIMENVYKRLSKNL